MVQNNTLERGFVPPALCEGLHEGCPPCLNDFQLNSRGACWALKLVPTDCDGTLNNIGMTGRYGDHSGRKLNMCIYDHDAGNDRPGNLIACSGLFWVTGGSGLREFWEQDGYCRDPPCDGAVRQYDSGSTQILGTPVTEGEIYWLAICGDDGNDATLNSSVNQDPKQRRCERKGTNFGTSPPDPFGTPFQCLETTRADIWMEFPQP